MCTLWNVSNNYLFRYSFKATNTTCLGIINEITKLYKIQTKLVKLINYGISCVKFITHDTIKL